MPRTAPKPRTANQPPSPPDTVHPIWLAKAVGLTILAAAVCGYITLCLLFYQGQWQLILHPARTSQAPASIHGIPYQLVHFADDASATPQLTGWWIPATQGGQYSSATLLFLSSGDGSLADHTAQLASLHTLGINIFAFDYRGYGQSAATHPSQQSMQQDADSALHYLSSTRSIPTKSIVPYGIQTGASLATTLAAAEPAIPAIILEDPHTDLLDQAKQDPRTRLLPTSLLFRQRFPLAAPLASLPTPKLLISHSPAAATPFLQASSPKQTVELSAAFDPALLNQQLLRFLDQYLPAHAPALTVPSPAPSH